MIYLTSFFKSKELPDGVQRWSAAVYQPKGYDYPKARWTDIRDSSGRWIRPREFIHRDNPRQEYRQALLHLYSERIPEATDWFADLDGRDAALMCWCPYDKAAQRQLSDWGSFICHTAVIGEFITQEFNVPVWYDADRLNMTVLGQEGLSI